MYALLLSFILGTLVGWTLGLWPVMTTGQGDETERMTPVHGTASGDVCAEGGKATAMQPMQPGGASATAPGPTWGEVPSIARSTAVAPSPDSGSHRLPRREGEFASQDIDAARPSALESFFYDDQADGIHSETLHRSVSEALQARRLSGVVLDDLECRSMSCRLVLADSPHRSGSQALLDLELAAAITRELGGAIELSEARDAWGRPVFYVAGR